MVIHSKYSIAGPTIACATCNPVGSDAENAEITGYYGRFGAPEGSEWFVVTTIVTDPAYLAEPVHH